MASRERLWASLLTACAFAWPVSAAARGPSPKRPTSVAPASSAAASPGVAPGSSAGGAPSGEAALAAPSPGEASAAEAYDQGVELYRQKRYGEAARAFGRADGLSPHPVALRQALEAAMQADDPPLAMAFAERVEAREGDNAEAAALVARARSRYAEKAGKFVLRCPPRAASCGAIVDGDAEALDPPLGGWALAGVHTVHLRVDGRAEPRTLLLAGGQTVELSPVAMPPPAPERAAAPARAAEPLGPGWFWGGVALTGVLAGASVWSGLDTASRHDDFERDREAGAAGREQADDGRAAQLRTNVLGGATIVAGLATAALGLFAVRWRPRPAPAASALARPAGGGPAAPPGLTFSF
ncbi:MAG TPA: hypothetical protein VFS43_39610 [Polyangiaceae bacterium]|nr:hypothetical protein [Polyangiaceae bacterium]